MSFVADEIAMQPAAWQRAVQAARGCENVLPRPGERVAVVGCGTSWFMAEAYAVLREAARLGETDFFTPAQLPTGRRYDRIVAITRSGTTTEVLRLLGNSPRHPTVAITADPTSPAVDVADAHVALDFADEKSVVQTVFATTALALLRSHIGQSLAQTIAQARTILDEPTELAEAGQFTFLGHGWAHAIAREAALKLREAAQLWTESYPTLEYRHGPISIAEPGRVVWIFGEPGPGLLDDVRGTGATLVHTGDDPMADLVRVQRLAVEIARRRGLDPDRPRHLTRSVVLAD